MDPVINTTTSPAPDLPSPGSSDLGTTIAATSTGDGFAAPTVLVLVRTVGSA